MLSGDQYQLKVSMALARAVALSVPMLSSRSKVLTATCMTEPKAAALLVELGAPLRL